MRRPPSRIGTLVRSSLCLLAIFLAQRANPVPGQTPISNVRYAVTFDKETAGSRTIRVDMSFETETADPIALALPAWTPGSYELDNFARHVRNFEAHSAGSPVRWDKLDYDTWRVHPGDARTIRVTFDYRADTLDTGMAWSAADFAFFNGTNLFLYPEGTPYDFAAEVTIHTEPDWQVATGMTPSGDPAVYRAEKRITSSSTCRRSSVASISTALKWPECCTAWPPIPRASWRRSSVPSCGTRFAG